MKKTLDISMKFWTLFIGIGALVGALMMWIDPTGKMWLMDPLLDTLRQKMPWPDVFFRSFIPSGFVLLTVNGFTQYFAAYLLFRRHPQAPLAVAVCGLLLMLWIALEWCLFGFYFICNLYFTFGVLELLTACVYLLRYKYGLK